MLRQDTALIKVYQKICFVISIVSITGGMLAAYLMKNQTVFYFELFISVYFFLVPRIKLSSFYSSFFMSYLILCGALIFWGITLGPTSEISYLIPFLIGLALYVLKNKAAQWSIAIFDVLMIFFLEANYYNHWFKPVAISDTTHIYMSWIVKITAGLLSTLLFYQYQRKWVNEKIALEKANDFKKLFIFIITHDIRTQLNSIYYIAQLLKREIRMDLQLKKLQPYNDLLFTLINNASNIINNVLDISSIEAGKMESLQQDAFRVKHFFENIIEAQKVSAKTRRIELRTLVDERMPEAIVTDHFKLHQVVTNLLNNAIKYADKDSIVTVQVDRLDTYEWSIAVINEGVEIPSEKQDTIFDQFVTNKKNKYTEGTGLGLYIVKNFVTAINGTVSLESKNGNTKFIITLALQEGKAEDVTEEEEEVTDLSNIRILVADDDEMNNMLLSKYFRMCGCTVASVNNGLEVINKLDTEKHLPDVILMDNMMPEMDAIATLTILKQTPKLQHIPVIICTGTIENQHELMAAGAAHIAIKPINQKTLFNLVSRTLWKL
jgi:signal transduction histidine kinase/CheY-like chemotaxis protein